MNGREQRTERDRKKTAEKGTAESDPADETMTNTRPIDETIARIFGTCKVNKVTKVRVTRVIKSRVKDREIGEKRADKVWDWVARTCVSTSAGKYRMAAPKGTNQSWIGEDARTLMILKGEDAWKTSEAERGDLDKRSRGTEAMELRTAIKKWLRNHENPPAQGQRQVLRQGKLKEMRMSLKNKTATRGGPKGIYASLARMEEEGTLTLETIPKKQGRKGQWTEWIQDSLEWATKRGWPPSTDGKTTQPEQALGEERSEERYMVLDLGEGWGSVGRAVKEMQVGARVVGVDRRGHTKTGRRTGIILSEVQHDLGKRCKTDQITAISRKASVSARRWDLIWISAECTLFSSANQINQKTGTAHGIWAQTDLNKKNARPEKIQEELGKLAEATRAIDQQLTALESHPRLKFAWESPAKSEVWKLTTMEAAMNRNPGWRLVSVDQCAYGRKAKKPTKILTNLGKTEWTPRGQTGTGKCKIMECAGTANNVKGDKRHEQQTATTRTGAHTTMGETTQGKREFNRDAAVNAVAAGLVQEIAKAAFELRDRQKKEQGRGQKGRVKGPLQGGHTGDNSSRSDGGSNSRGETDSQRTTTDSEVSKGMSGNQGNNTDSQRTETDEEMNCRVKHRRCEKRKRQEEEERSQGSHRDEETSAQCGQVMWQQEGSKLPVAPTFRHAKCLI